jgi:hypothetical protein
MCNGSPPLSQFGEQSSRSNVLNILVYQNRDRARLAKASVKKKVLSKYFGDFIYLATKEVIRLSNLTDELEAIHILSIRRCGKSSEDSKILNISI